MATFMKQFEGWDLPSTIDPKQLPVVVDAFLREFHESLKSDAKYALILAALSPAAWRNLETAERQHMLRLLAPELNVRQWQSATERLVELRLRHGIPVEWISESHRILTLHLETYVENLELSQEQKRHFYLELVARLFQDASLQTAAYSRAMQSRDDLLDLPIKLDRLLLNSVSTAELYSRLTEFLLQISGIDGVWLGSPNPNGLVQHHFVSGDGMEEYLKGKAIYLSPSSVSPLHRCLKTGKPEYINDWANPEEPGPMAYWRERGLRFGWRSSCAIPVSSSGGDQDVLILYSKVVNFFAPEEIRHLIQHLHALLGTALERLRLMDSLEEKQKMLLLYKTAMDASANGIVIAGSAAEDYAIRYVNPAFERITGYSASEVAHRNCRFLQKSDRSQPELETLRSALQEGKPCSVELRNYRKDGTQFWNAVSIAPVQDDSGKVSHFIGIQSDVTQMKQAQAINDRANALYRALMETAELIIRAQSERELLDGLCRMLVEGEMFPHVWIGRPNVAGNIEVLSIFSRLDSSEPWYRPNVYSDDEDLILAVRAWRRGTMQYTNDRMTDPESPVIQDFHRRHGLHATAVVPLHRDGELWGLLTLVSKEADIFNAELIELLERISRLIGHGLDSLDLRLILEEERKHQSWLARHDPLTDVLNRRGLLERLQECVARASRHNRLLAVAIMDIDGFKAVNDLHGHPAGDLLLRTIAERVQETLRQTDVVGRLGSDEFVLILEDLDAKTDLGDTLRRVLAEVAAPVHFANGRSVTVRGSIGVTLFPNDDSTPERLLRHADRALYALKEEGADQPERWMLFHAEADEKKIVRQKTILSLFRAGMVRVQYQPIIDLQTGRVSGVEALARLADEDGGLLQPGEFLPQLNPSDLTSLTQQVLAQSIVDMQCADKSGFPLYVGINMEPSTLTDPKAMDELRRQIVNSGLPPQRILLELLERDDTLSVASTQQVLHELKTSGVRVALDDVGSAYSSLLRVKELPIDIIKLDRSFSIDLEHHPKELRFLMNLIHLMHSMGMEIVAEGIESETPKDALSALGVKHGQGYGIARPMDFGSLLLWLERHKTVAWTRPMSPLGAVALQLRGLDATARILSHRPTYLNYIPNFDPDLDCDVGIHMNRLGPVAARLSEAHRVFHGRLSALCRQSGGGVKPDDFDAARMAYEEELFRAVAEPPSSSLPDAHLAAIGTSTQQV